MPAPSRSTFEVHDTGQASPDRLGTIFDPFVQASAATRAPASARDLRPPGHPHGRAVPGPRARWGRARRSASPSSCPRCPEAPSARRTRCGRRAGAPGRLRPRRSTTATPAATSCASSRSGSPRVARRRARRRSTCSRPRARVRPGAARRRHARLDGPATTERIRASQRPQRRGARHRPRGRRRPPTGSRAAVPRGWTATCQAGRPRGASPGRRRNCWSAGRTGEGHPQPRRGRRAPRARRRLLGRRRRRVRAGGVVHVAGHLPRPGGRDAGARGGRARGRDVARGDPPRRPRGHGDARRALPWFFDPHRVSAVPARSTPSCTPRCAASTRVR